MIFELEEASNGFYLYASSDYAKSAGDTYTFNNLKIEVFYPLLKELYSKADKSELDDYVTFTDYASTSNPGVVKINNNYGIVINPQTGEITTSSADPETVKAGSNYYRPIAPYYQHYSVFYGLAKAAGDVTQSASSNAVGAYTDEAKAAIKAMLGIEEGLKVVRLI